MANDGENTSKQILDESECLKIVEKALNIPNSNLRVIDHKLNKVSNNIFGFCGDYFELIINFQKENSSITEKFECFLKTLPQGNIKQRELIDKSGAFRREKIMYLNLFEQMDKYNTSEKWHGSCYYARDDILVLEDLRRSGFKLKDENVDFCRTHLESSLKCVARMHVNSIAFENSTGVNIGDEYGDYLTEDNLDPTAEMYIVGCEVLRTLIDFHPKYRDNKLRKNIHHKLNEYLNKMEEYLEPSKEFRNVLCHRDLWDKNILFKYSEDEPRKPIDCIFLDFASCRYTPPALDALQFVYLYTTTKSRRLFLNDIIELYYKCLLEEGHKMNVDVAKEIPWNDFLEGYEFIKPVLLISVAVDLPFVLLPEGLINDLRINQPQKYNDVCYVTSERISFVYDYLKKDENYREVLMDAVEELVEFIIKNL